MMNEAAEKRTMEVVLEDIKKNISDFNLATNPSVKNSLELALKTLENEYNELSLLDAWTGFMAEENPMVAFAKAYDYPIVGHKDVDHRETKNGVKVVTHTRALVEDKTRMLNVQKFVEWTEERNASVAHDKHWRKAVDAARASVIDQWKGFMAAKGDTRAISITKMKKALQAMVDALVFVEGSKGGNALVVKSDVAKAVFALCNQRKDGLKGSVMSANVWQKLQVDVLHATVAGKEFTINYGDEEEAATEQAAPATEAPTATTEEPAAK